MFKKVFFALVIYVCIFGSEMDAMHLRSGKVVGGTQSQQLIAQQNARALAAVDVIQALDWATSPEGIRAGIAQNQAQERAELAALRRRN